MSEQKKQIWLPVILSLTVIIGMIFGYKLKENMGDFAPSFGKKMKSYTKLNEIMQLIHSKYVDSVHIDTLNEKVIKSLLKELDPHSSYISEEDVANSIEELKGNYNGIGIQFEIIRDTVTIISVMNNTPSEKAGLQVGDQIINVDSLRLSGHKLNEIQIKNIIRGKKGSNINITIKRDGKIFRQVLQRGSISSKNIDAAYNIAPGIAYIKIGKFSGNAYEEFMEHLERLKHEGMTKLILDLRDNGGGVLDDAVQIADEFLDGTKEIVRTQGQKMPLQIFAARRPGLFESGKLILLINENTASASEVLAGAIQDWNRGTILGRRSFGKGLVQEQFSLADGSAIRLTIARYYTPLGRSIQKPYHSGTDTNYLNEIKNRLINGELSHNNNNFHRGKMFMTADGRKLYSEEGIDPDVFIPVDSAIISLYKQYPQLNELLTDIAIRYYKKNKSILKGIKNANELSAMLKQDPDIRSQFKPITNNQYYSILNEFENIIAWIIWKEEGYYQNCNRKDPVILKAMELIKN